MAGMPKQRKRAKYTRSKSGCRVCRIRKVKCDQTRPACIKCTSTGRECEGYPLVTATTPNSVAHMLLPRTLSPFPGTNPLEERSFSYFKTRTIPQFSAPYGSDFWSRLVLQVGDREPSVRHALVALGALHEDFEAQALMNSVKRSESVSLRRFAGIYYSKALSVLSVYIGDHSWEGLVVSLTCCIICIGFEWLRGGMAAALSHLRGALRILSQWYHGHIEGLYNRLGTSPSSPNGHLIRSQIVPVMMRLAITARTAVSELPHVQWRNVTVDVLAPGGDQSTSMQDARFAFEVILSDAYLQPETQSLSNGHGPYILTKVCRDAFSDALDQWYKTYSVCLYEDSEAICEGEKPQLERLSLTIRYLTVLIMLRTSHTKDQTAHDSYIPQFTRIVHLSSLILNHDNIVAHTGPVSTPSRAPTFMPRFRIDMDAVPMLYFTATKCRHPLIRRKAAALLRTRGSREGFWDGYAEARLADEVIFIEEEGLGKITDETCIPAERRVYMLDEEIDLETKTLRMRFARQDVEEMGEWRVLKW
ncbi:hypothetical protein P280DRAFT_459141 [Massarina eburnea CBS 473.64]|uniref:Zn(2)-C6 fungal-type domain-containing protein n=1 Tax=Massarina eburnea CBS 473.64 TaxID=1395130 RepID=A0A6A6RNF4_9PLEO|nr:hypothetical protein P280DRAFT_459141 [Massarina eburnea CBS 473.64]